MVGGQFYEHIFRDYVPIAPAWAETGIPVGVAWCFIHDGWSYAIVGEVGSGLYRHKQVYATATLPRLTKKGRVPYCNNGERREGGRDERSTALQQGSKTPQSVPAEQIEPIIARGIFSFGIFFSSLSTSPVIKCMNALTRVWWSRDTSSAYMYEDNNASQ